MTKLEQAERQEGAAMKALRRGFPDLAGEYAWRAKRAAANYIADEPAEVFGIMPSGVVKANALIQRVLAFEESLRPLLETRAAVA